MMDHFDNWIKARIVAAGAHIGQKYGNKSYFDYHIQGVVELTRKFANNQSEEMQYLAETVAYLHDVVEDTDVTLQQLREKGFDKRVVRAVRYLTKQEGVGVTTYYRLISTDFLATIVKMADTMFNMSNCVVEGNWAKAHKYQARHVWLAERIDWNG